MDLREEQKKIEAGLQRLGAELANLEDAEQDEGLREAVNASILPMASVILECFITIAEAARVQMRQQENAGFEPRRRSDPYQG